MMLTVRNVDKSTWHKFKVLATQSKLPVGRALNLAINKWVSEHNQQPKEKHYGLDLKPIKFPDNVPRDLSENVDKYVYGE